MSETKAFIIQAYSFKEIIAHYGVSWKTFKNWIAKIPDLGEYTGKKFTPNQVQKIVDHLGKP
ncbi:hypothetical protein [Pseudopedobacter beijingensis]|uniref:DUF4248 domain-containing protein n=1 Tax=Pseudopedobacter beijingensis TaxID=1207056 RepID=A0ABW4II28_9SPHI